MNQGEILGYASHAEIVAWCDVDRSTASRWKAGISRAPASALKIVQLRAIGDAAALLGPDWAGWRFGRDCQLYAPGWRRGFTPGEILALPYLLGQVAALRSKPARQDEAPPATVRPLSFARA